MADLNVSLEIDASKFEKHLRNKLESSGKLQPVLVGCEDPMAKLVEFGMNNGGKVFSAKNPPEEFKQWVGKKYGVSGDKRESLSRKEYYKFKVIGMPPMPFFRPALHNVLRRVSSQKDWFNKEGNDTMELGRLIEEEMKRMLKEKDVPMGESMINKMFHGKDNGMGMSSYIRKEAMSVDDSDNEGKKNSYDSKKRGKKKHAGHS